MPEITLKKIAELERLALAAKEKYPAPWFVVGKDSWRLEGFPQVEMSDEQMSYFPVHDETLGNFCAATDPETVLALVKALREAWEAIAFPTKEQMGDTPLELGHDFLLAISVLLREHGYPGLAGLMSEKADRERAAFGNEDD